MFHYSQLLFLSLTFSLTTESISNNYEIIITNTGLNTNYSQQQYSINSFECISRFHCLAECNRNEKCKVSVLSKLNQCILLNNSNIALMATQPGTNTIYMKKFSKYQDSCEVLQCDTDLNLTCGIDKKCGCSSQAVWSTIQNKCVDCPAGSYVKFNRCYLDMNLTEFRPAADTACLNLNATLVKIRNSDELLFFNIPFNNQAFCTSGIQVTPFEFYWQQDNTELSSNSSLFCDTQPNNFGANTSIVNQPYIILTYFNSRFCINDKETTFSCTVFCEFNL